MRQLDEPLICSQCESTSLRCNGSTEAPCTQEYQSTLLYSRGGFAAHLCQTTHCRNKRRMVTYGLPERSTQYRWAGPWVWTECGIGSALPIGWADFDSVGPSSGYRPFMGVNLSGGAAPQALTVQQSGDTQEWHLALLKALCEHCSCNGQAAIQ